MYRSTLSKADCIERLQPVLSTRFLDPGDSVAFGDVDVFSFVLAPVDKGVRYGGISAYLYGVMTEDSLGGTTLDLRYGVPVTFVWPLVFLLLGSLFVFLVIVVPLLSGSLDFYSNAMRNLVGMSGFPMSIFLSTKIVGHLRESLGKPVFAFVADVLDAEEMVEGTTSEPFTWNT